MAINVSDWAYDGVPNYPLKVTRVGEGKFEVTSPMLKGKTWTGETSEKAMIAFREESEKLHSQQALGDEPDWMVEERAKRDARGAD